MLSVRADICELSSRTVVILEDTNRIPGLKRVLLLYRLIQIVLFPLIVVYFAARFIAEKSYRAYFGERLGFLNQSVVTTKQGGIWLHGVSVGEIISGLPLLRQIRSEHPHIPLFVSTGTIAGRQTALKTTDGLADIVFYAPLDLIPIVRKTLRQIRPQLVIVLETEIWPAFYSEIKRAGSGLAIVNGRISDRTWPRYQRWNSIFKPILQLPDAVFPQSAIDGERYSQLGVKPEKLFPVGNLKFDGIPDPRVIEQLPDIHSHSIWIAASTAGPDEVENESETAIDEDDVILQAWKQLLPSFEQQVLLLAPRQPKRFSMVADKLQKAGIPFVRRSQQIGAHIPSKVPIPGVLLVDTIGELAHLYSLASVVFVGGSLAPRGGHNILEPAAAGAAVIVGPHMRNFAAITEQFRQAQALIQISSSADLPSQVGRLLQSPDLANQLGQNAKQLVQSGSGATRRVLELLWPVYGHSAFRRGGVNLRSALLTLPAMAWEFGGRVKRKRGSRLAASQTRLPVPVVSIGSITIGGAGKTPLTAYLAKRLREQGMKPAILTRGYRRRSSAHTMVFAPGTQVPVAYTGDEAQIFLRAGDAAVGIGANRHPTAQLLLSRFPDTDLLLLDDGFQHARLQRQLDIVVIDGLNPFGDGNVVPLGRLREPLSALSRADVFVVNRAESDQKFSAVEQQLRQWNSAAPVFRTRLTNCSWHDYLTGAELPGAPQGCAAAFCGLGNPEGFWRTLQALGVPTTFRWEFPDHHVYKTVEIHRLAHHAQARGAHLLVTTEKDLMNLPVETELALGNVTLAWLKIEATVDREAEFLALIHRLLSSPDLRLGQVDVS